jgi:phosphopantothenoylcysteine decarboxylase/phosphopantothenate--cysteine ligase
VAVLRERGALIVGPGVGALGSRNEWGSGRLAEPAELLAAVEAAVPAGSRPWDGLRVLVTAGGTREPIDAVRYVGNRSSGRMGFALADEAAALGADVTVVAANVALPRTPRVSYRDVGTASELREACLQAFPDCDVLLMAAAVADFTPTGPAAGKLKKDGRDGLTIELEPTTDVLAALAAARRPGQVIVGFAAEHGDGALAYGREKLQRKGLDAIVVNDVSGQGIGFDALENEVTIVTARSERHVPRATKPDIARAILGAVDDLRTPTAAGTP